MNFTPLDSSRQRASFQIKIFAKFAKKKNFFNFRRFLAQKKLLDERNPTVPNSSL
jgi:predicted patatin/cPLA2 family phospholipase